MSRDIPSGWAASSLQELCRSGLFTDGDWIESKDQDPAGKIRLIQLADIGDGTFINKSSRWINAATADRLNVTKLQRGDVLLARMPDPIGRSCIFPLDGDAITAVDVCIIRPAPKNCDRNWLMQALNSGHVRSEIAQNATGTTRQRISRGILGNIRLSVPPIAEQRRIAEILSSVDEAIQATQAVIEQTRKVKDGVLQRLLTKGIGHTRFKQTEIGEIPERWEVATLGDLALPKEGLQTGPFGSQLKASEYVQNGIPIVMPKDIVSGRIVLETIAMASEEKAKTLEKHRLLPGDILFARRGDIGRCGLIAKAEEGFLCGTGCLRARLRPEIVSPDFLAAYLASDLAVGWLNAHAVGQTMLNLNTSIIGALPVPLPPISEQAKIADLINAVDEAATTAAARLEVQTVLKSALMSDLLTGRRRVSTNLPLAAE